MPVYGEGNSTRNPLKAAHPASIKPTLHQASTAQLLPLRSTSPHSATNPYNTSTRSTSSRQPHAPKTSRVTSTSRQTVPPPSQSTSLGAMLCGNLLTGRISHGSEAKANIPSIQLSFIFSYPLLSSARVLPGACRTLLQPPNRNLLRSVEAPPCG